MNTVSPREFLDTYFPQRDVNADDVLDFAAKMRGELPIFKRINTYTGQARLDAWAHTEAQTRTVHTVAPVTCNYDALLAYLDAEYADDDEATA